MIGAIDADTTFFEGGALTVVETVEWVAAEKIIVAVGADAVVLVIAEPIVEAELAASARASRAVASGVAILAAEALWFHALGGGESVP